MPDVVRKALAKVDGGYVDAPEGSIAVAAADVTAACQGNPSGHLPENVAGGIRAGRALGRRRRTRMARIP
ncbi:hypothetical protein [Arthrobacter sp. D3-16]